MALAHRPVFSALQPLHADQFLFFYAVAYAVLLGVAGLDWATLMAVLYFLPYIVLFIVPMVLAVIAGVVYAVLWIFERVRRRARRRRAGGLGPREIREVG